MKWEKQDNDLQNGFIPVKRLVSRIYIEISYLDGWNEKNNTMIYKTALFQ